MININKEINLPHGAQPDDLAIRLRSSLHGALSTPSLSSLPLYPCAIFFSLTLEVWVRITPAACKKCKLMEQSTAYRFRWMIYCTNQLVFPSGTPRVSPIRIMSNVTGRYPITSPLYPKAPCLDGASQYLASRGSVQMLEQVWEVTMLPVTINPGSSELVATFLLVEIDM